jgi:integrase
MSNRNSWGTARKLPSGRYQIRYRIDGERRLGDTTYRTKREADNALAAIRTDIERGTWFDPKRARETNFGEYAARWLELRPELAPKTVELYQSLLRIHLLPALGDLSLADLTTTRIRSWHASSLRRTSRSNTAKCYRLIRAMLNTAIEDDLILKNPCRIKGASSERSAERPVATVAEVQALVDAIEPRLRLMVLLGTYAGLRQGEIRALTRKRIDLNHCEIHVVEQIQDLNDGSVVVRPPKSDAGRRTVSFPPSLALDVRRHLKEHAASGPDGLLFCTRDGNPIRKGNLHNSWAKARDEVGLRDFHFHDLRHTGNTLAAATGASTRELMARMGHSSPRAALIYQHATRDRDRRIASQLDDLIAAERQ